jgi:hypothetical protein
MGLEADRSPALTDGPPVDARPWTARPWTALAQRARARTTPPPTALSCRVGGAGRGAVIFCSAGLLSGRWDRGYLAASHLPGRPPARHP